MTYMHRHQESEQTLCAELGLIGREACTLNDASSIIVSVFEAHGYDIQSFKTLPAHHLELQCSHYSINLSHRRSLTPIRMPDGSPCKSHLQLTLTPHFPQAVDREISEILLVMCLQGIVEAFTDVVSIFWLNEPLAISRDEFLSVFETERYTHKLMDDNILATHDFIDTDTTQSINTTTASPCVHSGVDRPFDPIEQSLGDLELHCNRLIANLDPDRVLSTSKLTHPHNASNRGFAKFDLSTSLYSCLKNLCSLQVFNLTKIRWRLQSMGIQVLMFIAALCLFDVSTGVQAALN